MNSRRSLLRYTTVRCLALLAVMGLATACAEDEAPKTLSGYQLTPAASVAAFSLPDASAADADFVFKAAPGHLLIVYFCYMGCPDVCPTTLAELKKGLRLLGGEASRIDVAMGTIDPGRDTGENLTKYVQSFIPDAHALRTDDQSLLEATTAAFGANYSVTTTPEGTIEVGHSASLYVVDAAGAIVLTWPYGIPAQSLADDMSILLAGSAA